MITYSFLSADAEPISDAHIDQLISLYRDAGWWESPTADRDHVRRMINGSHCFLVAKKDNNFIGTGRAISDGESDAYIQDVTVSIDHRHKQIGSQIVTRLAQRVEADGLKWIGLIAERNTHAFYERIGFKAMPNATPMLKTIS